MGARDLQGEPSSAGGMSSRRRGHGHGPRETQGGRRRSERDGDDSAASVRRAYGGSRCMNVEIELNAKSER